MNHKKIIKSLTAENPKKPGVIRGINRLVHTKPLPDLSNLVHFFANRGQERPLKVGVKAKHYQAAVARYIADGYSVTERD